MKENEQKSPEYVPHGPVRVRRRTGGDAPAPIQVATLRAASATHVAVETWPHVPRRSPIACVDDDADTRRMRAAHAARMGSDDPPTQIATIEIDALAARMKKSPENMRGLVVQECRAIEQALLALLACVPLAQGDEHLAPPAGAWEESLLVDLILRRVVRRILP